MSRLSAGLLFLLLYLLFSNCAKNGHDPVFPEHFSDIIPISESGEYSNRTLLGQWVVSIDPVSLDVSFEADRNLDGHVNVTPFIPKPVVVVNNYDATRKIYDLDVTLMNPSSVDVYDVRLIIYYEWFYIELTNADDWTDLYDIPGEEMINPFKAYAADQPNRIFSAYSQYTENILLHWPYDSHEVIFAVDASIGGNCFEPYSVENFVQGIFYQEQGSDTTIQIDVLDWQDNVSDVFFCCEELTGFAYIPMNQLTSSAWTLDITNETGTEYLYDPVVVCCRSSDSAGLALYDILPLEITIGGEPPVWESTVGITGVVPSDGEALVTWGPASDNLTPPVEYLVYKDFDSEPWDQEPVRVRDAFEVILTGFDPNVEYWFGVRCGDSNIPQNIDQNTNILSALPTGWGDHWVKSWGNEDYDSAQKLAVDHNGNIVCSGYFSGTVDFDPGPGTEERSALMNRALYVSKFDSDGNFLWVNTFGGAGYDWPSGIDCNTAGDVYVTGYFNDLVDFDPGPDYDWRASNGFADIFIIKFNASGDYLWCSTIGGQFTDRGEDLGITSDDKIIITGYFSGTVDFDPGPGTDVHTGDNDAYVAKYNSDGSYVWTQTWHGAETIYSRTLALDENNNICTGGSFRGEVDFDPGPGIDINVSTWDPEHSTYSDDAFISSFNAAGEYQFSLNWGGKGYEYVNHLGFSPDNHLFALSYHNDQVDLDPGSGEDIKEGRGLSLSKFEQLEYIFGLNWEIPELNSLICYRFEIYQDYVLVGGYFGAQNFDFDPGPGVFEVSSNSETSDPCIIYLNIDGEFVNVDTWYSEKYAGFLDMDIDNDGNIIGFGSYGEYGLEESYSHDFDPGDGVDGHRCSGYYDVFIMKILEWL